MSIPTTEEVRAAIAAFTVMPPNTRAVTPKQFDVWLESLIAQKRAEWEAEQGEVEWEYGWAGDAWATVFYDTREEAEEFMGAPKKFARRKAGPWEEVDNGRV